MTNTMTVDFRTELSKRILLFDGAIGTMLQAKGLDVGEAPENWNIGKPELVEEVHKAYVNTGCDIVTTNSFGGSPHKLTGAGISTSAYEINRMAAEIAKRAAQDQAFVAGSIGPTGAMLLMGEISEDDILAGFSEQVRGLVDGGADLIIIGVSSAGILEISKKLAKKDIPKNVLILSLSKGIIEHKKRLYLPSEAMELYLPDNPIAALSGLTFAEEIFEKADTFANVALNYADTITKRIDRKKMYERLKKIFNIGHLTTFRYDNILWVETGGAAKNVYGIASGYTNRMLQLRHNRSGSHDENLYLNTLLSLAMYTGIEMRVIYNTLRKKDRNPRDYLLRTHVFTNQNIPAWDGDRYGTLLGRKSRNFRYGELKAEGRSDKDPEIKKLGTVEGINTTKQLTNLFDEEEKKIHVPLLAGVNEWLVGKTKVEQVVKDLIEYLRSVDGRKGSKKSVSKTIKKKKQESELDSSDSI